MGPMKPVAYVSREGGTSLLWSRAFAKGCGGSLQEEGALSAGPVAFWGSVRIWHIYEQAKAEARTIYYGDHAYFGRKKFFRCTKGAMQHDGLSGNDDPHRFQKFGIPVRDWRKTGGPILLCPNSEVFLMLHGLKPGQWVEETTAELRKHTDREIVLRWKKDASERPLKEALKTAWAVVTFTSNSAVEAILAGVPAICTAPCAALSMSTSGLSLIEKLPTPEGREQWAARLANNQWTTDEMARGDLWRSLGEM